MERVLKSGTTAPDVGTIQEEVTAVMLVGPDGKLISSTNPLPTTSSGGGGGGGGGSSSGIIGVDANGVQWLMVVDSSGSPAVITYFKVSDGTVGTPTGGFIPDSDQNGATAALQTAGNSSLSSLLGYAQDSYGSGTITTALNSAATFACEGKGTVVFTASGTWAGSIVIEFSPDNVSWYSTTYVAVASGGTASTFSAPTAGQINTVGFDYIRLRSNTVSSGSVSVNFYGSRLVSNVMLDNPLPAGSNTIGKVQVGDGQDVSQGAIADTAATSDTGAFSVISLIKRGLQNWTALLAKLPTLSTTTILAKARLDVNLAAGGAPGSTAPAWADQVGGLDDSGNLRPLSVDSLGRANTLPDGVIDNATLTSATLTSTATAVSTPTKGYSGGSLQVTVVGTSVTTFEQSNDNTNWLPMYATPNLPGALAVTSTAASGLYGFSTSAAYVRARVSAFTNGTVLVVCTLKRRVPQPNGAGISTFIASDGLLITPDSYAQTMTYDGSNNLSTVTVTSELGNIYRQTLTYTSGLLTGVSRWVKQ